MPINTKLRFLRKCSKEMLLQRLKKNLLIWQRSKEADMKAAKAVPILWEIVLIMIWFVVAILVIAMG